MIIITFLAMLTVSIAKTTSQEANYVPKPTPNMFDAYRYQTESECLEALEDLPRYTEDDEDACMDRIYNDELDTRALADIEGNK